MTPTRPHQRLRGRVALLSAFTALAGSATFLALPPGIASASGTLEPGNLLVSTSMWQSDADVTAGTTQLPPNCGSAAAPCATAVAGGNYPYVFNNDQVDGSFGVTEPIVLDQLDPSNGQLVSSLTVPNSTQGLSSSDDQMVTSFSSKSELALNLSTDDNYLTFMGYNAPVGALDVSNSNTPGDVDPTNSAGPNSYYRVVGQLDANSNFQFTETNAYSGNNGRAAILDPENNTIYTAGNAGNGTNPEPQAVVQGAGSQILSPAGAPESSQSPAQPAPLGNFNVKQLGLSVDKSAKDDNFRGLAVNNSVVYLTKGSGGNGVDTVYFVDTTGAACPSGGVGLPSSSATLPAASSFTSPTFSTSTASLGLTSSNPGLTPTDMCVLEGFPTTSAKNASNSTDYPFGIWFANPTTLYVADEGSGDAGCGSSKTVCTSPTYTDAEGSTTAGLQKWVFNGTEWVLAYTLQNGLNLGQGYSVADDSNGDAYPTGMNTVGSSTLGPWTPATDGLRNLTGQVNSDGTVTIWATTSTVSGSGDQGADPNELVSITDNLAATSLPASESFSTVMPATYGQVIRGVSFTPGTGAAVPPQTPEVPWVPAIPLAVAALGGAALWNHTRSRPEHLPVA